MANTHTHTMTFTAKVPESEMDRASIYSPAVRTAKDALLKALHDAGHPHEFAQAVKAPRKTRGPRAVKKAA